MGTTERPTITSIAGVDRLTLKDRIATSLRAAIFKGELSIGQTYSVGELARRFGTSATPVREALLDLEAHGLIEIARNVGFRVPMPSQREVANLIAVRKLVEIPALMEACGKLTPATVEKCRRLIHDMRESAETADLARYMELDREFHLALVACAGNPVQTDLVGELRDRQRMPVLGRLARTGRLEGRNRDHELLLNGVIAGDHRSVRQIATRHLELNMLPDDMDPDNDGANSESTEGGSRDDNAF